MTCKQIVVDYDYLVYLCQNNVLIKILLEIFSLRQKKSWTYTIESLSSLLKRNGCNFPETEIKYCCKVLQDAGCGNFENDQFTWTYNPIDIGKEVMRRLNG